MTKEAMSKIIIVQDETINIDWATGQKEKKETEHKTKHKWR